MAVATLKVGQLQTNCYLYYHNQKAVIIDPGDDADFIITRIKDLGLQPQAILATHGHFDHVMAAHHLQAVFNIPFYLSRLDLKIINRMAVTAKWFTADVQDQSPTKITFISPKTKIFDFKIIPTPGHTAGSISLYSAKEKLVFSGDLIFAHGLYGRTDLEGGSQKKLFASIKKILRLPQETTIFSGHGEQTTVELERQYYPNLLVSS